MRNAMRTQCEPDVRIADATDGRTNEQENRIAVVNQLRAVDARRAEDGFATLGEVIAAGIAPTGERHQVVRIGERDEIPFHVRAAVWHRDRGRCELCGWQWVTGAWHLDHIVPWSAGGSDRSENLRVLCEQHNLERSNYVDPTERPRRPATWWCTGCMSSPWGTWRHVDGTERPLCPRHGYSQHCAIAKALTWITENDAEDWWTREPIDPSRTLVVAFCAHCKAPGLTDQPL